MGSMKPYYPTINLGALASLTTIKQQSEAHEDYLDREECPYDEDTRDTLRRLLLKEVVVEEKVIERIVEKVVEKPVPDGKRGPRTKDGPDVSEVQKEVDELRQELRQLKIDGKGLQVGDKIQIIKTRAGLIEKMAAMSERVVNIKRMSNFQSAVLGILDDLMNDDQRQEFMRRMEPYAENE